MSNKRVTECDQCHKQTRRSDSYYARQDSLPTGWFRLTGGSSGSPDLCSIKCVEDFAKSFKPPVRKPRAPSTKKRKSPKRRRSVY